MKRHFCKLELALAAVALLSFSPQGFANTSYGEVNQAQSARQQAIRVTDIVQINPTTVDVRFSDNQRMTLDFYGENIFRLFQDKAGGILRDPEAKPEAQILVDNPRQNVSGLVIENTPESISVATKKVKVTFDPQTGLMQIINLETGAIVMEEARPAQFEKTEVTLTIHEMPQGSATRTGEIVFKLKGQDYRHKCTVSQYDYQYGEDEVITLQKASRGNNGGINLVFLGDGYDAKDISEGKYMENMQEQVENFFGIEPYTTYRDYFNVYTAIAVSPESGIGTVNTIRYAKFETTYTGGVGLKCDYDAAFQYALDMGTTVTKDNLHQSLIIMVPNSTDYGGICQMWEDGSAIAFCPLSTYGYPLDTRGVIQHEAGGHGFGKLGDEYIYHNEFIDFCTCTCCGHVFEFNWAKGLGWYDNLSLTGKMNEVPWSHLIFDPQYSDYVDIFEGGFMHNRGVFRSEQNSCMNNDIPYYSAISRESIVKRIKAYAGEAYSFEDFKANDKADAGAATRGLDAAQTERSVHGFQLPPQIHKGSPLQKRKQ